MADVLTPDEQRILGFHVDDEESELDSDAEMTAETLEETDKFEREENHDLFDRRQNPHAPTIPDDKEWRFDPNKAEYLRLQERLGIQNIKEMQAKVLSLLHHKVCVLLLARTGWGKSLIFQGLFFMLYDLSFDQTKASRFITVIFVPLSALGQEQAAYINQKANKPVAIFYDKTKTEDEYLEDIRRGKYLWVFMSPERALHTQTMKVLWEDVGFRAKILLLAVDEGHLVSDWLVFIFLLLCRIVLIRIGEPSSAKHIANSSRFVTSLILLCPGL